MRRAPGPDVIAVRWKERRVASDEKDLEVEVEHLREERDQLQKQVDTLEDRPGKRMRLRRIGAVILVALTVLVFAAGVAGAWARRTVLNTDRYVATVGPLAEDPAVQEYLARTITNQVFQALDVQGRLEAVLQERADRLVFLAGPITSSVQGFVQDQVDKVVSSEQFARLWTEVNRLAQESAVKLLEGDTTVLTIEGEKVVLNLIPVANEVLKGVSGVVSELIGRTVTIPEITPDTVPSEAITKLEQALGIDLPDDFGTVVVYDSQELAAVQQAVDLFNKAVILLAVLFVAGFAAALWVSPAKRRTLLQLMTALAVVLVLERRFAIAAANDLVDSARPENQAAARAIVDAFLGSLLRYTGWFLAIALIVLVVTLLTGPYPWAVRLRGWVVDLGRALGGMLKPGERTPATEWIAGHRDPVMMGIALLGVLALLAWDLSIGWFLILALVIGGLEVLVFRIGESARAPVSPGE
jgi:predicted regulator of Ras-like GTPase activity (Roadblock/LC7/MglB family)